MFSCSRQVVAIWSGIVVLALDVLSKLSTHLYLPLRSYDYLKYPYGGIPVFKSFLGIEFSINHVTNSGAAWGILSDFQIYLLAFRIFLVAGLLIYFLFFNKQTSRAIPLALVISGAIGNIVDTVVYGHVVDMFHFILWGYDFPVFNVADSFIFIGVVWLVLESYMCHECKIKKVSR